MDPWKNNIKQGMVQEMELPIFAIVMIVKKQDFSSGLQYSMQNI